MRARASLRRSRGRHRRRRRRRTPLRVELRRGRRHAHARARSRGARRRCAEPRLRPERRTVRRRRERSGRLRPTRARSVLRAPRRRRSRPRRTAPSRRASPATHATCSRPRAELVRRELHVVEGFLRVGIADLDVSEELDVRCERRRGISQIVHQETEQRADGLPIELSRSLAAHCLPRVFVVESDVAETSSVSE